MPRSCNCATDGNAVTTTGVSVVASLYSGSGTLTGTTSVNTTSGVATFSNLIITGTVGSYTLEFTPVSLTAITSGSFTLAPGAATKLAVNTHRWAALTAPRSPLNRSCRSRTPTATW